MMGAAPRSDSHATALEPVQLQACKPRLLQLQLQARAAPKGAVELHTPGMKAQFEKMQTQVEVETA